MHKNQSAITRKYRKEQAKSGMKAVTIWVPAEKAAEIKAIARGMRGKGSE